MRLNKLILNGFKSFADRTEFVFDAPIVGIVGPNGCGKSNVVDAFKWVLGEQSAKSLRGDAMLDVIFNGSSTRKPSGMSEVVLVFDNPRRDDGSRFLNLDTEEVYVGRRLFRDGTSEYQLNNQPSRLKDIRELFLDTGVGVDAYSVIEQGRVAAMLESNPAERRLIFEEAAGISKFKIKKRESQRKLEKVHQNLLRLHDIVEEVEKRLRSVKVQAGRARTYQEHSARLSELRLSYSLQEYHTYQVQLRELDAKREDAQFRLDDISGDLQRKQNELAGKRDHAEHLSQRKQRLEHELVQARAQMEAAQQRQQFASQQLRQIAEQIASLEHDREDAQRKQAENDAALARESESLARLIEEMSRKQAEIERVQQAFHDGQLRQASLEQQLEQHKSAVLELMRQLATTGSQLGAIEIERKNIVAQQSRLAERRRAVIEQAEILDAQRGELSRKLDAAQQHIAAQQHASNEKRNDAAALGIQIAQISEQLGAAKEHRSGLISRQKLLQDLEARREGVSEGVKAVLRQREEKYPFIRGLLADVMRVDVEHARVIEAALDGRDQWLVADTADRVFEASHAFEDFVGRVNVLCFDRICGVGVSPPLRGRDAHATEERYDWNRHTQRVRLAIDLVRFESHDAPLIDHILGNSIVVDDLTAARELHESAPKSFRYVTMNGEVLEPDGTVRAGPLTAAMGLLSRRSELDAIGSQIAEVDARIEHLARQLTDGNAQARALEEELNALRNAIYQLNTEKVEITSQSSQIADQLAGLGRERPVLDRELAGLLDQIGRLKEDQAQLTQERERLECSQAEHTRLIDEASSQQREIAENLNRWGEELTICRVALGQVQEKQLAAQQHVQRQTALQAEVKQQLERISQSVEATTARRAEVETELASAKHHEATLLRSQEELSAQLSAAAAEVSEIQQAVTLLAREVDRIRESHTALEQSLHEVQLQLSELRVRTETLVTRTMEELQLDLPARYADGYEPAEMNWDVVAEEIKELREKIQRLGNVNLDAIGEQTELEERQQYLSKQFEDLTESKRQLEELIDTINRESGIRFEQTFNAVREHFQGMFRKLFGGGKADIYLETELEAVSVGPQDRGSDSTEPTTGEPVVQRIDPLEAGIEIIARPPGKQPVTISQLSGGEKTMTCVALLMSIFKSKPSPFCILDEVDAALDEANNQRFNLIVQEFLERSQFIIITHSKRTMQVADVLYGVTMQEQGVSKRVAVKFDQIDAHGRISESAAA